MKKKLLAFSLALALFISSAAAATISPMWTYMSAVITNLELTSQGLDWTGYISAYPFPSVTDVKVVGKLQAQAGSGWGTLDTQTSKEPGTITSVGGVYKTWFPNRSYRIEVYGYVYNGSTIIETVGPIYQHLNT